MKVLLSLILIAAAIVTMLLAPRMLTRGHWQVRFPRTALTLWFGALSLGIVCALVAVILPAALSALEPSSTGANATVLALVAWLSLGSVGAVAAYISASAEPISVQYHDSVRRFAMVSVAREEREGVTLVWFDDPRPMACAVPGRHPEIFVSTRLKALLTPAQLQAVLAHEYAHIRFFHGWALRIAQLNALCLPARLRAGATLYRATLLLIELTADDAAARQAGAVHLANALERIGSREGDGSMLMRAERLTLRRWRPARRARIHVAARRTL